MLEKSNVRNVAHIRTTGHFFRFVFAAKFSSRSRLAKFFRKLRADRTRTCDSRLRRVNPVTEVAACQRMARTATRTCHAFDRPRVAAHMPIRTRARGRRVRARVTHSGRPYRPSSEGAPRRSRYAPEA